MADNWMEDDGWMSDAERRRQPDPNRGQILPLRKTEDGVELAWPQFMVDAFNAVTLPKDTLQGYNPTVSDTTNFALGVGGGGVTTSAISKPDADLGMFLGRRAKDADTKKLSQAMSMSSQGVPREEIWAQTGWWQKPDGEWAWEMSDDGFQIPDSISANLRNDGYDYALTEELGHPAPNQYKAKPNSEPMLAGGFQQQPISNGEFPLNSVVLDVGDDVNVGGSFDSANKILQARAKSTNELRKILLHEIQHGVQDVENWGGKGSNPELTSYMQHTFEKQAPKGWKVLTRLQGKLDQIDHARQSLKESLDNSPAPARQDYINNRLAEIDEEEFSIIDQAAQLLSDPEIIKFNEKVKQFRKEFGKDYIDIYNNNEGEMISNLTAARADMSESERIAVPPWEMFDRTVDYGELQIPLPVEEKAWTDAQYNKFLEQWMKNPRGSLEDFNRELKEAMNGRG